MAEKQKKNRHSKRKLLKKIGFKKGGRLYKHFTHEDVPPEPDTETQLEDSEYTEDPGDAAVTEKAPNPVPKYVRLDDRMHGMVWNNPIPIAPGAVQPGCQEYKLLRPKPAPPLDVENLAERTTDTW